MNTRNEEKKEFLENEEYEVPVFAPKKITMTNELLRRQYEEELKKKYCGADELDSAKEGFQTEN